jgi:hypothetical protein
MSSQSESIKFSRDQSESITQILVVLLGVYKQIATNFHRLYYVNPVTEIIFFQARVQHRMYFLLKGSHLMVNLKLNLHL